ncbi:MAG: DUF11 domain-containing protein [Clostridia bacterium]
MLKNKMSQKVLAGILVFTLTFANFAFTTEALATSIFETWFGEESSTGHKQVEFDAYFGTEEDKSYSVISDVNAEELAITLDLNVKDSGYLKDAKIAIKPKEEDEKLNFKLKGEFEETETIQNVEDDVISLKQVDYNSEVVLNIPIEYQNEEYVNDEKLYRDSQVVFTGIYVDDEGEETELLKEVDINVFWKDDREVKTSSEVTKYIKYGDGDKTGVILQTVVNVDNTVEGNSLPVRNSIVKIEAPKINGVQATSMQVLATSTAGTNGKSDEKVEFGTGNWGYDAETNMLTISVANEKELVEVSNAGENDNLIDGEAEVSEEERFYSKSGMDTYVITYTYEDLDTVEEANVNTKVNSEVTTFSGVSDADYINKVTNEEEFNFELNGETGDIVSYNINNETESISKAYTYVNYNSSDRYQVEYNSKTTINISYSEIVEGIVVEDLENYYVSENGSVFSADDVYYKQIKINKDNMINLLGEDGSVTIKDIDGNELVKFDNNYEVNDDGDLVFDFISKNSRVVIETSKAISQGNLIISNIKESSNSMYSKEEYKTFKELVSKTVGKAKYTYVDDLAVIGETENKVILNDVTTKATLVVDRDNLSTLTPNEDVELRLELNNNTDESDVYGHSEFEIRMPDYVTDVEVTDSSIMYGEGLDISNIEVYDIEGAKYIKVTVDGTQNTISTGVLNNGTNIVLNTNIKVDLYAPATESQFVLKYTNAESTSYEDGGLTQLPIYYSAPTGLVTVNSTSNFDFAGTVLTSIKQGEKEAEIAKNDVEKVATMEIIVMNNNNNIVSDLSILGRIPFKGVKDIKTGEDLGTTIDTTLVSGIVADEKNNTNFTIYYSENGEATKDLSDSSNGWTTEVENFDNIKSYLIVPTDSNYEMLVAEVLRFTYEYKIPADLKLNESIYGTFLAYYKNHTDVATVDEESKADKIGLSTGEGPELSIKLSSDVETSIKEYEEMTYKVEVKNTGKTSAQNVKITIPVDNGFVIKDIPVEEGITSSSENGIIEFTIPTLGVDEVKELRFVLSARAGEEKDVSIKATATADDLEEPVVSDPVNIAIEKTVLKVEIGHNFTEENTTIAENREVKYDITATNLSNEDLQNAVIEFKLPDEVSYKEGFLLEASSTPTTGKNGAVVNYDDSTRTVTVNVGTLKSKTTAQAQIFVMTKELDSGSTYKVVTVTATAKADNVDTVTSNEISLGIGRPSLVFTQTTNTTDTYVTEGETIEYVFTIKNEGSFEAQDVSLIDYVPEGLLAKSITYGINGRESTKRVSGSAEPTITVSIPVDTELKATVKAIAKNLDGAAEATVTNKGSIQTKTMESPMLSNEITHIIEADPDYSNQVVEDAVQNTGATSNSSSSSNSNIVKTYKITGNAWLDEDKDGMRAENEQKMSGITARLVNADTGTVVKSITTDSKGAYTFAGVANGNYLVIFDYDTVKYTVTTYQKAGVEANVNSDAITTKIEQDGRQRNAAVTDRITIADSSVSNMDIGFVYADTFDLSLETSITKMTVQNKAGTDSVQFDNVTLAQMPIAAKYLSSSTTYIEYNIKVSNVGEIAGNVKRIIDYIPAGMKFNSTLNPDWYTGTDGNLYTSALADVELKPGETREIKLVLTKQMTEENTSGIVNNIAEIAEDYNIYGVSDINSTPMNKAQGENDMGSADAIITVKTGEVFIYISVIITSVILGSIVIFIAYTQIILKKRKAGV